MTLGDGRVAVAVGDHLALFGDADAAVDVPRGWARMA